MSSYSTVADLSDEVLLHWLAECHRLRVDSPKAWDHHAGTLQATTRWLEGEAVRRGLVLADG